MGGDLKKSEVALSNAGGPQNGLISVQMQLADPQESSQSTRSDEMWLKPVEEQVVALMGASSGI
jgi:hypothetical protein